jgi:hypothetical protein
MDVNTLSWALARLGREVVAFPNPTTGRLVWSWQYSDLVFLQVDIFNVSGERVALLNRDTGGGPGSAVFNLALAPGIYFCRVTCREANGHEDVSFQKIAVLKSGSK